MFSIQVKVTFYYVVLFSFNKDVKIFPFYLLLGTALFKMLLKIWQNINRWFLTFLKNKCQHLLNEIFYCTDNINHVILQKIKLAFYLFLAISMYTHASLSFIFVNCSFLMCLVYCMVMITSVLYICTTFNFRVGWQRKCKEFSKFLRQANFLNIEFLVLVIW